MKARLDKPPELVRISLAEKAQRLNAFFIDIEFTLQGGHVQFVVIAVDKRANEFTFVKKVYRLRRGVNKPRITGMQVIWRPPFRERSNNVKDCQNSATDQC